MSVTIATLQNFTAAWNGRDIDALMAFMTDDCEFHAVAGPNLLGSSFHGRAAVKEAFQRVWNTYPDASWTDGDVFVCGDRGVAESTFRGTRASDGMRIEARMVDVFHFHGDKIRIKNAFRKDCPASKL